MGKRIKISSTAILEEATENRPHHYLHHPHPSAAVAACSKQPAASSQQHPSLSAHRRHHPHPTPTLGSISDPPNYSSMYLTHSDAHSLRYSAETGITSTTASHLSSWPPPPGVDVPSAVDPLVSSTKRSSEVLYHPTALSAYDTIGQTEAWYSAISLAKRPRFEIPSSLPIYPQRPGEKDCTHYMLTRTCKFGDTCKFDHPIWIPEGGIPDWKEVPLIGTSEFLPEKPGEPDCPYFLKTQRCKYGFRCKFNHPKEGVASGATETFGTSALPDRPSEPPCAFYLKTGKCKFGATCKFHHPKDIQLPLLGQEDGNGTSVVKSEETIGDVGVVNTLLVTPALFHNSKGLPMRMGEVDCPFYLKTGSCKYGATCRYNHPERNEINPPVAAFSHTIVAPSVANLNIGVVNPASSLYQTIDPRLAQSMLQLGVGPTIYPQRPGQAECDFYMKTGECKFGERCKYHHPPQALLQAHQQNVKLTLAGLPRREGSVHCPYYMKTGTCKYGATCKFDHPPPGEVMAVAASQGPPSEAQEQGAEVATF